MGGVDVKSLYYSYLRQLMAKYGLNKGDIAKLIGKSYRQTIKKLNREASDAGKVVLFDVNEAGKVAAFFKSKGENVTIDMLFFDNVVSNESISA
jgi:DNA-binding XRE family transcriptional regulator